MINRYQIETRSGRGWIKFSRVFEGTEEHATGELQAVRDYILSIGEDPDRARLRNLSAEDASKRALIAENREAFDLYLLEMSIVDLATVVEKYKRP